MSDIKNLQHLAVGFSVLYVEDNDALRENAAKLLKKFFKTVHVGADGQEGIELFKKYKPLIVITDIKMPKIDGMELAKRIKHISPDTKVIIMSAFDEKDYLYKAIEIGVFRFIKKPVNIAELTSILQEVIHTIEHERQTRLLQLHIGSIFNYQSSMIVMLKHTKPVIANQPFLDFYEVEDTKELNEKYQDIGVRFLEHDGFLYNTSERNWINEVLVDRKRIFNVKMKNKDEDIRHFILKCKDIPDKNNYGILSFDDVTELNLLELFDKRASDNDKVMQDKKSIFNMLKVIQRNSAKINIHNYYKGISITNDAVISELKDDSVVIKTTYVQQKAIQFEKKCLIVSEALPFTMISEEIVKISFEEQTVELKNMRFLKTSPVTRETIRIVPEETHTVSMFMGETKFSGEMSIVDISLNAVKLKLSVLPAGLALEDEVVIDMVFTIDKKPLIINTKAKLFNKRETKRDFELVFLLELEAKHRSDLVKYITKRQMAIIREFKGLQNG